MHSMRSLVIVMVIMAMITFADRIPIGDVYVQMAAAILSGLLITWYAAKFICFACKRGGKATSK